MSDLISRYALIKAFDENNLFLPEVVEKLIRNQPTAYDVEAKIKELEELYTDAAYCYKLGKDRYYSGKIDALEDAMDIISIG